MKRQTIEAGILLLFALVAVGLVSSLFVIESPAERKLILPCLVGAVMGLATFAGFLAFGRSSEDPTSPTVVASLPDEMSASAIVRRATQCTRNSGSSDWWLYCRFSNGDCQ